MWDLPRPGLEPVSPALAGRFLTTAPPGKPPWFLNLQIYGDFHHFILLGIIFLINLFIYLFLDALGLRCCRQASHCSGFSCCRARALGARASVVVACGLSSCGARAYLLHSMWDLPGPGIEPMSPVLAGGFLTTAPPRKSC